MVSNFGCNELVVFIDSRTTKPFLVMYNNYTSRNLTETLTLPDCIREYQARI